MAIRTVLLGSLTQCVALFVCLVGVASVRSSRLLKRELSGDRPSRFSREIKIRSGTSNSTSMTCEAWQAMRGAYKSAAVPISATTKVAYNFCRLISVGTFRLVNDADDHELYFACDYEQGGALRLRTCLQHDPNRTVKYEETHMCKVSIGYVHEGIKGNGDFHFPLTEYGAEFKGTEWAISGKLDWSDNRHVVLTSLIHIVYPSGEGEDYKLKKDAQAQIEMTPFDAGAREEMMTRRQQLDELNRKKDITLGCAPQNSGVWKGHPCFGLMERTVATFCSQLGQYDQVFYYKDDRNFKMQFLCVDADAAHTTKLRVFFTRMVRNSNPVDGEDEREPQQFGHEIKSLLFDYINVNDPNQLSVGVVTDTAGHHACLKINIEERKIVWTIPKPDVHGKTEFIYW